MTLVTYLEHFVGSSPSEGAMLGLSDVARAKLRSVTEKEQQERE